MNYNFYFEFFEYTKKKFSELFEEVNFGNLSKEKNTKYKILIDYSSCKSRLYGGFFPDWIGGEWKKMNSFYDSLKEACITHNLEIIIFFDGTSPNRKEKDNWKYQQLYEKMKIEKLYDGIYSKFSWVAPSFLHKQIQFETKNLIKLKDNFHDSNSLISITTFKDHAKEILNYCLKHNIDALLTEDMQLISLLQIQKFIVPEENSLNKMIICSAQSFKITLKHRCLTSIKYDIESILSHFKFNDQKFIFLSLLLGTRLLPNQYFKPFYEKLIGYQIKNIFTV
jgi:hypothetical protein